MSLPTLAVKTVLIKLPISEKKVKIRPFTVREQKSLLLAVDQASSMENEKELESFLINEFKTILQSCVVESPIELDDMTISDFTYLMLQLRSISVGESSDLRYTCPCKTKVEFNFDIDDVIVKNKKENYEKSIKLDENIHMVLDLLHVKDIAEINDFNPEDILLNTIAKSIKKIYNEETVYETKDVNFEDVKKFVEQIPVERVKEIEQYFEETPYLAFAKTLECPDGPQKVEVNNISDFF